MIVFFISSFSYSILLIWSTSFPGILTNIQCALIFPFNQSQIYLISKQIIFCFFFYFYIFFKHCYTQFTFYLFTFSNVPLCSLNRFFSMIQCLQCKNFFSAKQDSSSNLPINYSSWGINSKYKQFLTKKKSIFLMYFLY